MYWHVCNTQAEWTRHRFKPQAEIFLWHGDLQEKLLTAAISSGAIKNQSVPRRIPHKKDRFNLFERDDNWCLEFLRFNRRQICELAVLLDIPSQLGA
jgi:hypothetical protein